MMAGYALSCGWLSCSVPVDGAAVSLLTAERKNRSALPADCKVPAASYLPVNALGGACASRESPKSLSVLRTMLRHCSQAWSTWSGEAMPAAQFRYSQSNAA